MLKSSHKKTKKQLNVVKQVDQISNINQSENPIIEVSSNGKNERQKSMYTLASEAFMKKSGDNSESLFDLIKNDDHLVVKYNNPKIVDFTKFNERNQDLAEKLKQRKAADQSKEKFEYLRTNQEQNDKQEIKNKEVKKYNDFYENQNNLKRQKDLNIKALEAKQDKITQQECSFKPVIDEGSRNMYLNKSKANYGNVFSRLFSNPKLGKLLESIKPKEGNYNVKYTTSNQDKLLNSSNSKQKKLINKIKIDYPSKTIENSNIKSILTISSSQANSTNNQTLKSISPSSKTVVIKQITSSVSKSNSKIFKSSSINSIKNSKRISTDKDESRFKTSNSSNYILIQKLIYDYEEFAPENINTIEQFYELMHKLGLIAYSHLDNQVIRELNKNPYFIEERRLLNLGYSLINFLENSLDPALHDPYFFAGKLSVKNARQSSSKNITQINSDNPFDKIQKDCQIVEPFLTKSSKNLYEITFAFVLMILGFKYKAFSEKEISDDELIKTQEENIVENIIKSNVFLKKNLMSSNVEQLEKTFDITNLLKMLKTKKISFNCFIYYKEYTSKSFDLSNITRKKFQSMAQNRQRHLDILNKEKNKIKIINIEKDYTWKPKLNDSKMEIGSEYRRKQHREHRQSLEKGRSSEMKIGDYAKLSTIKRNK